MPLFSAVVSAVAISAAQDLFEIVAPATSRIAIRDIKIGQHSDFGDAAAEILGVSIIRGHTTTGSGGSAVTPVPLNAVSNQASAATVARNNTTIASNGTTQTIIADAFNVQGGWALSDVLGPGGPEAADKRIVMAPSERLVVRLTAPADALTFDATLIWEEGGSV